MVVMVVLPHCDNLHPHLILRLQHTILFSITDEFGFIVVIMKISPVRHGFYTELIPQAVIPLHCVTNTK
jgi:hypothetical protein